MKYQSYKLILMLLVWCINCMIGCASTEVQESPSAESAFNAAKELQKDERYEEAISKYSEVKNKHPYSKYALDAELEIADIHFVREAYIEAAQAYQLFKEFHPKYNKIEYVTFRLALSYFHQLPSTIDRDLQVSQQALQYFDEVIKFYPSSEYVIQAREKRVETLKMLAEKELYIAHFYFKRKNFSSALGRFSDLLKNYPDMGFDKQGLYGACICAVKLDDKKMAQKYLGELKTRFPDSDETSKAQQELVANGIH